MALRPPEVAEMALRAAQHVMSLSDNNVGRYFDVILSADNDGPCVVGLTVNNLCCQYLHHENMKHE